MNSYIRRLLQHVSASDRFSATQANDVYQEKEPPAESIPVPDIHSPEIQAYCRSEAADYEVVADIHEKDFIFHFVLTHPSFSTYKDAVHYYFDDGCNSARKLSELLTIDLAYSSLKQLDLLEFASGYGCVTRHLGRMLPGVNITSCDIHEEATTFITSHMDIPTVLSHSIPEKVELPQGYDVIFALSFFSHMPRSTWGRWIHRLFQQLKTPGYLIFTTHGKESMKFFPNVELPPDGFYFTAESEQKDLSCEEYGETVALPDWVIPELYHQIRAPLVCYKQATWWGHQDLYIVARL